MAHLMGEHARKLAQRQLAQHAFRDGNGRMHARTGGKGVDGEARDHIDIRNSRQAGPRGQDLHHARDLGSVPGVEPTGAVEPHQPLRRKLRRHQQHDRSRQEGNQHARPRPQQPRTQPHEAGQSRHEGDRVIAVSLLLRLLALVIQPDGHAPSPCKSVASAALRAISGRSVAAGKATCRGRRARTSPRSRPRPQACAQSWRWTPQSSERWRKPCRRRGGESPDPCGCKPRSACDQ